MKKKDKLRKNVFRDFVLRKNTEFNYLQQIKNMKHKVNREYPVTMGEMEFLLWATDFEFWTLKFAAKQLGMYKTSYTSSTTGSLRQASTRTSCLERKQSLTTRLDMP